MMAPFFPIMLQNVGLSPVFSGIIFGINTFAYFLTPCLVGSLMLPRIGRKPTFILGSLLISISMFVFGCLAFVSNKTLFLALAFASRTVVSFGNSFTIGAMFSIVSVQYPEHAGKYAAFVSASLSIGTSVAPFLGGFMFDLFNIGGPFFLVSLTVLLQALLAICILQSSKPSALQVQSTKISESISFFQILAKRRSLLGYMNFWMAMTIYLFLDPTLSVELANHYSFTEMEVSWYFAAYMGSYCLTSIALSFCK